MRIVILTGAGISAESGLGTFRDLGGIWSQVDLTEVATPEAFEADPARVLEFYNARRAQAYGADPNPAHRALAELQSDPAFETVLVTQNVDDLHERAGAETLHMHGRLARARCYACSATWDAPEVMAPDDACPRCGATATRPDVVWFGEIPHHMEAILDHLAGADLFAAIGTSGQVYPAAGFVAEAAAAGAETVELNTEASEVSGRFDRTLRGPASKVVPEWVSGLRRAGG